MLIQQRASFEQTLQERLSFLSGKGVQSPKVDKDTIVRKLKADIKAVNNRLRTVAGNDKRSEEMAKIKAERESAPRKEQEGVAGDKLKKASDEIKGKKAKPEGGKKPKSAEPPGEGKKDPAPKPL
jgi:hypothetical protein